MHKKLGICFVLCVCWYPFHQQNSECVGTSWRARSQTWNEAVDRLRFRRTNGEIQRLSRTNNVSQRRCGCVLEGGCVLNNYIRWLNPNVYYYLFVQMIVTLFKTSFWDYVVSPRARSSYWKLDLVTATCTVVSLVYECELALCHGRSPGTVRA